MTDDRITTTFIARALAKHGLLPANCRLMEVQITPMGALILRYETFVTPEDFAKFAQACMDAAAEMAQ